MIFVFIEADMLRRAASKTLSLLYVHYKITSKQNASAAIVTIHITIKPEKAMFPKWCSSVSFFKFMYECN